MKSYVEQTPLVPVRRIGHKELNAPTISPLSAIATPSLFGSMRYGHCVDPPVKFASSSLRRDPFPHDRNSYTRSNSVSTSLTRRQN